MRLRALVVALAAAALAAPVVAAADPPRTDTFFDNSTARTPVPQVFGETFLSRLKSPVPLSCAGECL